MFTFAEEVKNDCADSWRIHTILNDEGNQRYKVLYERLVDGQGNPITPLAR